MQQRHNDRLNRRSLEALRLSKSISLPPEWPLPLAMLVLALASLSCGMLGSGSQPVAGRTIIRTHLPTLTPTASGSNAPIGAATPVTGLIPPLPPPPSNPAAAPVRGHTSLTSLPTLTPTPITAAASEQAAPPAQEMAQASGSNPGPITAPPPAPTAFPTSTPVLSAPDWSFANVQFYPDQYGAGLVLYGDVINNTGVSQELTAITGAFYDAQGQLMADGDDILNVWPIEVIPAGGRLPFELAIPGLQNIADFDLSVQAQPNGQMPHQNFDFPEVNELIEDNYYCLTGQVQNLGAQLHTYLMVVAVLYDSQDRMINFSEYYEPAPADELSDFEICVDLINPDMARYELRAWGE
jgi:hypothetical protein